MRCVMHYNYRMGVVRNQQPLFFNNDKLYLLIVIHVYRIYQLHHVHICLQEKGSCHHPKEKYTPLCSIKKCLWMLLRKSRWERVRTEIQSLIKMLIEFELLLQPSLLKVITGEYKTDAVMKYITSPNFRERKRASSFGNLLDIFSTEEVL